MAPLRVIQLHVAQSRSGGSDVVVGAIALCAGFASVYAALRLGYAGGVIGSETYGAGVALLAYGGSAGGVGIAGLLGYAGVTAPTAVLAGLALPGGTVLGSLGTVAVGVGRYDSSPAVLFAVLLLGCCLVNSVGWVLGSTVSKRSQG